MTTAYTTQFDPTTRRRTRQTTESLNDAGIRVREQRVFDAEGNAIGYAKNEGGRLVRIENPSALWDRGENGWELQLDLPGGGRAHHIAGTIVENEQGLPRAEGPAAYAVYDADGKLLGFQMDLSAFRQLSPAARQSAIEAFARTQLARGLSKYQSGVYSVGSFYGADNVHGSSKAFAGLVMRVLDRAERQDLDAQFFLGFEDNLIHINLTDREGNTAPAGSLIGSFSAGSVPGVPGSAIGVYAAGDGRVGNLGALVYGPNQEFLPTSTTEEWNMVSGTDLGGFWNTLFGIRQTETTRFVERTRDAVDESFTTGRTITGGSRIAYSAPNALQLIPSSFWEGAQSIVAILGSGLSYTLAGVITAGDQVNRQIEDLLLEGLELMDPEVAADFRSNVEERRTFVDLLTEDLAQRGEDNFMLNPLVSALRGRVTDGAIDRAKSEHYIFNAPRELMQEAMRSEGAAKGALIGAAILSQVTLDLVTGIVAFGPVGGLLGGGARTLFMRGMQGMMALGALEAGLGEGGLVEAIQTYRADPSQANEVALYQSIARFSSMTLPFLAGAVAARGPRLATRAPAGGGTSPAPAGGSTPGVTPIPNTGYRVRQLGPNRPTIIELAPKYDHNGAFFHRPRSWVNWIPFLGRRINPTTNTPHPLGVRPGNVTMPNGSNPTSLKDFIIFQDHGSPGRFGVTSTRRAAEIVADQMMQTGKRTVLLDSCSQANHRFLLGGKTNAARFAQHLQATLTARGFQGTATVIAAKRPGPIALSGRNIVRQTWRGWKPVEFVPVGQQTPYPYIDPSTAKMLAIGAGVLGAEVTVFYVAATAGEKKEAPAEEGR